MSTPATRAAFRLAATLPKRTHRKPDPPVSFTRWTRNLGEELIQEARALEAEGLQRKEITARLNISRDTLRKRRSLRAPARAEILLVALRAICTRLDALATAAKAARR